LDFKFHAIAYRSVAGVNRVVLGGATSSNDIVFLDSTKSELGAGALISLDADSGEVYWSIGVKRKSYDVAISGIELTDQYIIASAGSY